MTRQVCFVAKDLIQAMIGIGSTGATIMDTPVPSTKRYDTECGVTVYVLGMDSSGQIHVSLVADWKGALSAFGPYLINPSKSTLHAYGARYSGEVLSETEQERIGKLVLDFIVIQKETDGIDLWFTEEISWSEHTIM